MPPKQKNRLPLHRANERWSAETTRSSICHNTPSLTSRIIPRSVIPDVLAEARIEEDSNSRTRIINDDEDPIPPTSASRKTTCLNLMSPCTIMTNWLHHPSSTIKSWWRDGTWWSTSFSSLTPNYKRDSDRRPPTRKTRLLWHRRNTTAEVLENWKPVSDHFESNFQTHKHLCQDNTDKVQYDRDHVGSWAYHTDRNIQKMTMIDPIT